MFWVLADQKSLYTHVYKIYPEVQSIILKEEITCARTFFRQIVLFAESIFTDQVGVRFVVINHGNILQPLGEKKLKFVIVGVV